jgi:hypothetical protein
MYKHYKGGAKCFWCDHKLIFHGGGRGPYQYSPDRPDPPQSYADGWEASCLACNRFFCDYSLEERRNFIAHLLEAYNPARILQPRNLTPAEKKYVRTQTFTNQDREGKNRKWTCDQYLEKLEKSGGVCKVTGIDGSFLNMAKSEVRFLKLVTDRKYNDDPYDINTTQVMLHACNSMKAADPRFDSKDKNPDELSSISVMRLHIEGLIAYQQNLLSTGLFAGDL